jgi:hypothetical protein
VAQVPVRHFPRKSGGSRGLPLRRIPRVILDTLRNFSAIKRDVTKSGFRKVS